MVYQATCNYAILDVQYKGEKGRKINVRGNKLEFIKCENVSEKLIKKSSVKRKKRDMESNKEY